MKYIDADALRKSVLDLPNCYNGYSDTYDKSCIIGLIEELSSAEPEIIMCKDCKFYEIAWLKKDGTDDNRYKPSICVKGQYGITRKPDWFCADAERKIDE